MTRESHQAALRALFRLTGQPQVGLRVWSWFYVDGSDKYRKHGAITEVVGSYLAIEWDADPAGSSDHSWRVSSIGHGLCMEGDGDAE